MSSTTQVEFRRATYAETANLAHIESAVTSALAARYGGDASCRAELTVMRLPPRATYLRLVVVTEPFESYLTRPELVATINAAVNGAGEGTYSYNRLIPPVVSATTAPARRAGPVRAPAAASRPLATARSVARSAVVVSRSPARSGLAPVAADKVEPPEQPTDPLAPASWVPVVAAALVVTAAAGGLYWLYRRLA